MSQTINVSINGVMNSSGDSFFDGGLLQWIGWIIPGMLATALTLGI